MAALSGGETCIKYLMFGFNLVFWLVGTAVLSIGLWLMFDPQAKSLFEEADSQYVLSAGIYVLIGAGGLMMVVGFLGCCGAIRESPCMLGVFFFFLLIMFAVAIAAGIWGFSNQTKIVEDIKGLYMQTCKEYMTTGDEGLKKKLQMIQTELNCCGPGKGVDESFKETCPRGGRLEDLLMKSCPDAIEEVFHSKLHIIAGVGVTMGVVMVFGMIFSMLLCCAIRKSQEVV